MASIDTKWFKDQISRSLHGEYAKGSVRGVARLMRDRHGREFDVATLSRLINGKRQMQIHEAKQLAEIFCVSLNEVLKRAGIQVPRDGGQAVALSDLKKVIEAALNSSTVDSLSTNIARSLFDKFQIKKK